MKSVSSHNESKSFVDVVRYGHPNVLKIIIIVFLSSLSSNIWSNTALAAYLLKIIGSNSAVGGVEAVSGLSQLISALPVGYFADKYGKVSSIMHCFEILYG